MYKESAYVYALSLAVITHTIAKGCATDLFYCSCSGKDEDCSADYVAYGLNIAKTFLHKRYTSQGGGLKQQLVEHNYKATETVS